MIGTVQDIRVGPGEGEGWDEVETGADGVDAPVSEANTEGSLQSPAAGNSLSDTTPLPPSSPERHGTHPPDPVSERKRPIHGDLDLRNKSPTSCGMRKRRKVGGTGVGTDDEGSSGERGESRSAAGSRRLNDSLKSGGFIANEQKRGSFEEKCERMGSGARFRYGEKWEVLHLKCGKWLTMTEPYNTTRFKAHLKSCKSDGTKGHNGCINDFFQPRVDSAGVGGLGKSTKRPTVTVRRQVVIGGRSKKPDLETLPVIADSLPCLGLRENHDDRIPNYISRALTEGAGSRSESHVTAELFGDGTKYSELSDQDKQLVQAAQVHSRAWTFNRELQAIYSTNCRRAISTTTTTGICPECLSVLGLKAFKKALSVERASLASKKYIPHRWRTAATDLAINLAEINGLPGLLEAVSPPSPLPPSPVEHKHFSGF